MEALLAKYQDELVQLRRLCREFAERYPRLAGKLHISGDVCEDPHIERMIEASALIAARVSKRLDDDYPQFTEALLELLYPHYLRPFPSCSIVRVDCARANWKDKSAAMRIPRGTVLESAAVNGVRCKFTTVYDVDIAPVAIAEARFDTMARPPVHLQLPRGATSDLRLVLETQSPAVTLAAVGLERLRLCIDGEPSFCAAVRDAMLMKAVAVYAESLDGKWLALAGTPVAAVGFAEDEAMLPLGARSHPAHGVLAEFFGFPDKFNFVDIRLRDILAQLPAAGHRLVLHIVVAAGRADSYDARMLQSLSADQLVLACTPVVNLFRQPAVPIQVNHLSTDYAVVADASHAPSYEVYSIDSVHMQRQAGAASQVAEFRPFYSLRHGEGEAARGRYWLARRDELVAACSPGYERVLTLVDIDGDPLAPVRQTLSLELRCTNRDLPAMLAFGRPEGDFVALPEADGHPIRFMQKPTRTLRFESGRGAHWRLISHLTLNQRAFSEQGLAGFRELLTLNDMRRSPVSQRQIEGIVGLARADAVSWRRSALGMSLVHGVEVRLTVDPEAFVGNSLHLFVQVIDRFMELYVQVNSFVELVVISQKTGEELVRCEPRKGSLSPA